MNVAYFPGCSLHGLAREYDISTRLVCSHLGINLQELKDWNCCGATAAHSLNHELSVSLSARNLAIANDMKLSQIVAPCAGCYSRLKTASYELRNNKSLAGKIEKLINAPAPVQPDVSNAVQLLIEAKGIDAIAEKVVKPLKNMKLAAAASETPIVVDLGNQVLESALKEGAEALVVACPMCQTNLDGRQLTIEAELGIKYNLPIIYFTQLMGLAFGYKASRLGLKKLLISPFPLLRNKGLV